jgi:DNA-binding IclR family transcriptional regulator
METFAIESHFLPAPPTAHRRLRRRPPFENIILWPSGGVKFKIEMCTIGWNDAVFFDHARRAGKSRQHAALCEAFRGGRAKRRQTSADSDAMGVLSAGKKMHCRETRGGSGPGTAARFQAALQTVKDETVDSVPPWANQAGGRRKPAASVGEDPRRRDRKGNSMIRSVSRALTIFDCFDAGRTRLSLHEISELIAMPKATTFRLVNTLERSGFLVRLPDQQYCLSLKLVRLAGFVQSTLGIRDIARPVMADINRETGETVTLNFRSGIERVVIEVVDTPAPLMRIVRQGEHVPLLFGATGRILLAFMPEPERKLYLTKAPGDVDAAAVERELNRFRVQGYALTRNQRVPGVTAVAVPIRDINGNVNYCVAITGPSVRMDHREQELIDLALAAGKVISDKFGAIAGAPAPSAKAAAEPRRESKGRRQPRSPATRSTAQRKSSVRGRKRTKERAT